MHKSAVVINRTTVTTAPARLHRLLFEFLRGINSTISGVTKFYITPKELSFYSLPHSSFATPARYLMEVFRRHRSRETDPSNLLIFNPFFLISKQSIKSVNKATEKLNAEASTAIFADIDGTPVAYFLSAAMAADKARFLSLLSTMDAVLDSQLLTRIAGSEVKIFTLPSIELPKKTAKNYFHYNDNYEKIYKWITERAISVIESGRYANLSDIPFAVVMPHHAGDVLFLEKALEMTESPVKSVVVNSLYEDILHDTMPSLYTIPIEATPMLRDGVVKSDDEYFWDIVPKISGEELNSHFFYYFRPCREYRICDFHLIDQFAFGLGASPQHENDLLAKRPIVNHRSPRTNDGPLKVLLHFEGGWPLKVYPDEYQIELLKRLRGAGYEITVLSKRTDYGTGIKNEPYTTLVRFKELLSEQHLFVGMDSFPVHYSAYVAGVPSICLFSSTKPVNSHAPVSDYYQYFNNNLGCEGCFGFDVCPVYNQKSCKSFSSPENVYNSAASMLKTCMTQDT